MQMSFTWSTISEEGHHGIQSNGKRTKTSHYLETLAPIPTSVGTNTISNWDIDGGLAADFDGSLSGLGAELGSTTYNMSEALLALPVFKQENLENGFQYILGAATSPAVKVNEETLTYLNQVQLKGDPLKKKGDPLNISNILHNGILKTVTHACLLASQGQSYEIKLKKLGDLSDFEGQFLRSTVRVCFHERRLQYMEKEQLNSWTSTRPGERILDVDIPLSYNLMDVVVDSSKLNAIDFIWDPTKETGIYVKVNCISTEFTAKKHGGEKGVPFRLQVETKEDENDSSKMIHCASCQIKVFKPKGADRKHKTDREKMEKRTGTEKDKYQPSYECTVLTEVPVDQVVQTNIRNGLPGAGTGLTGSGSFSSLAQAYKDHKNETEAQTWQKSVLTTPPSVTKQQSSHGMDQWRWKNPSTGSPPKYAESVNGKSQGSKKITSQSSDEVKRIIWGTSSSEPSSPYSFTECSSPMDACPLQPLTAESSSKDVTAWLQLNRFLQYVTVFQNFSGADLLRLTRDDLIQICGLADGIRLNNALQSRTVRPRLTMYMCQEPGTVYHAVYLEQLTSQEMVYKISELIKVPRCQILDALVQGPSSIRIVLTDEVVRNFTDLSRYWIEVIKDSDRPEYFYILLKGIE